jgi:hypothetical protein
VRRFLGTWALLSPAYLLAAALSNWLVLNLLDLTYEAVAAWLLVPVAQALVLTASSRRGPLLPSGRPPLLAFAPLALALAAVAEGLRRPTNGWFGFLAPESLQPLVPRAFLLLAATAFLVAAVRARRGSPQLAAFATLLLLLGLDAVRPYLASLPATLLPRLGLLPGGVATWGGLLALLFTAALAAQRVLEEASPWAARLLGASLAVAFGAVHAALLQLFVHPWLDRPWSLIIPAAVSVAASLAAGSGFAGLAPLVRPREAA